MPRREYKGAAQPAVLTAVLGGSTSDVSIVCNDLTNWPDGVGGRPFFICINRGTASEEKILCSSRTVNVLTVFDNGIVNGRGADGTAITTHNLNSIVEHVFTATDADEANAHVNQTTGTVHGLVLANVVTTAGTQTLTNKTISGGTVNATTLQQGGVQAVTTTGTQTLTNKTITSPVVTLATSAQTASYTLVASDASRVVEVNNAGATTLTVPTNLSVPFPINTQIAVLQVGAGQVTIAGASGVTVNGTPGLKLRTQWSFAMLIKRGENTWVVAGDVAA